MNFANFTKLFWRETPVNANKKHIIDLLQQSLDLSRRELQDWQQARNSFYDVYMPTTVELQNCYRDSTLDLHLSAVMENRVLNLTGKKYVVKNNQNSIDDKKTMLLRKTWFNKTARYAAESIFYGHSLIHVTNTSPFTVELIPRQHVIPQTELIVADPYNTHNGVKYNDFPDYLLPIELGGNNAGLLEKIFPLTILKRHSWGSWDEFEQLFGIPIRIAKTISADVEVKNKLAEWLDEMGRSARGVFPKGTELEIIQTDKTDAFRVFSEKIKIIDQQISKIVLGQTGTTDEKAYVGSAIVHQNTMQTIFQADLDNFLMWCNDTLIYTLNRHGYGLDNCYIDVEYQHNLQEKIKIDQALIQGGYKLSKKYIERIYNVKIADTETDDTEEPQEPAQKKNLNLKHKTL